MKMLPFPPPRFSGRTGDRDDRLDASRKELLDTLKDRVIDRLTSIKVTHTRSETRLKPFHEGLWYATDDTTLDEYGTPYNEHRKHMYEKGTVIAVLRCSGYLTGLCSYYDIVDETGRKRKIMWRVGMPFPWEPG